jgi:type IV pilus assembly protein PilV
MRHLQPVNSNKEAGFTLVEFSIATFIMMIGLLGLLQGVNIAIQHNLSNLLRNEAVSVVDEQLVEAKNTAGRTTGIPSGFDSLGSEIPQPVAFSVYRKINGGNFKFDIVRKVQVRGTKVKEVQITVAWMYKNKTFNHQATSIVTSPL